MKKIKITIISNITSENIFNFGSEILNYKIEYENLPSGQVIKNLYLNIRTDYLIVHLTPEFFYDFDNKKEITQNLNLFCKLIKEISNQNKNIIINTIYYSENSYLLKENLENYIFHQKINKKLIRLSDKNKNIYVLNLEHILSKLGIEKSISFQNYFLFRMPYKKKLIDEINLNYQKLVVNNFKSRKKVIAVDADNTLWGGILGDEGIEGIKCDNDYPGIIFKKFQQKLVNLRKSGIIIILVTKNEREIIKKVFLEKNMPLKLDHFVEIYANWEPKSLNLKKSSQNLNLDLNDFIFIDDNKFEIEEVKSNVSSVDTYQFNINDLNQSLFLLDNLNELKQWDVTKEDKKKTLLYKQEKKRKNLLDSSADYYKYLKSLKMSVNIYKNKKNNVDRITQLINKTNQFNLTTKRYSTNDILKFIRDDYVFHFNLTDKFGEMGTIGVLIIKNNIIDTYVISCRAFGRTIEKTILLSVIFNYFKSDTIKAHYLPTKKNKLVENFYDDCFFDLINKNQKGHKNYILKKVKKHNNKYISLKLYD